MRFMLLSVLLTLVACQTNTTGAHVSENSLDWPGVYHGITPCADCEGIDTTLALAADGTFELSTTYLGKSSAPSSSKGTFEWQQGGRTIRLNVRDGARSYRVEENRLRQLDSRGELIEGALADRYVLQKTDSKL